MKHIIIGAAWRGLGRRQGSERELREEGGRPCRRWPAAHLLITVNAAATGLLELLGIGCGRAILTQQPSELSLPALTDLPELVGFFSYSRDDDRDSEGGLTLLRRRIQSELRGQLGRSEKTLRLFQDAEAIPPGTLWEGEISGAIEQSAFFYPHHFPTRHSE